MQKVGHSQHISQDEAWRMKLAAIDMLAALRTSRDMFSQIMPTVADKDTADAIDAVMHKIDEATIMAEKAGCNYGDAR